MVKVQSYQGTLSLALLVAGNSHNVSVMARPLIMPLKATGMTVTPKRLNMPNTYNRAKHIVPIARSVAATPDAPLSLLAAINQHPIVMKLSNILNLRTTGSV